MSLIYSEIKLSNPVIPEIESIVTQCLVDTGSVHLCLPAHIAFQLKLKDYETREVVLADGKLVSCSYSGPVKIEFKKRQCFTGALILGDMPLLGSIPLEDMDLVIHPSRMTLEVNPANPNMAVSIVK